MSGLMLDGGDVEKRPRSFPFHKHYLLCLFPMPCLDGMGCMYGQGSRLMYIVGITNQSQSGSGSFIVCAFFGPKAEAKEEEALHSSSPCHIPIFRRRRITLWTTQQLFDHYGRIACVVQEKDEMTRGARAEAGPFSSPMGAEEEEAEGCASSFSLPRMSSSASVFGLHYMHNPSSSPISNTQTGASSSFN